MKKGCFGCFGGGCLVVIALVAVLTYAGYSFIQTTGRDALANELHTLVKALIDKGITSEEKNKETHEIANNFIKAIKNKELNFLGILTQLDKVFDKEHFVKTGIIGIYRQIDEDEFAATSEQKDAMKQLITALYRKNLQSNQLEAFSQILKASEWQTSVAKVASDTTTTMPEPTAPVFLNYDDLISKELNKESFKKALMAITQFTKENALEEIDENFDIDTYVSFDIKNIIFRLSNPDLAEELAEAPDK
jgi:hypothetical protein